MHHAEPGAPSQIVGKDPRWQQPSHAAGMKRSPRSMWSWSSTKTTSNDAGGLRTSMLREISC